MNLLRQFCGSSILSLLVLSAAAAATTDEMPKVSIVSSIQQRLSEAAGVVTIITRQDIRRMGATTLEQVLQTVPGLHVSTTRGFRTTYGIRGILSQNNADVLFKINGVPIRDPISNGRPPVFSMPVWNIRRIEVLRGPGSIWHGSDAVVGIINIVTLSGDDLITAPTKQLGFSANAYAGSLETFGGAWIVGGAQGGITYSMAVEADTTEGNNHRVKRDAQSVLDKQFGLSASLAPGRVQQGKAQFHWHGELNFADFLKIRGGFRAFEAESGVGAFHALSPGDRLVNRMGHFDLEYQTNWSLSLQSKTMFSYQFRYTDLSLGVLPKSPLFPNGLSQDNQHIDHQFWLEHVFFTELLQNHTIQFGAGFSLDWMERAVLKRNFVSLDGILVPLPKLTEMREIPGAEDPAMLRRRRFQVYGIVQDEWRFAPAWRLTYGSRVDSYFDERTVFSPRVALVHYLSPFWAAKLIYNRAHHVQSFVEHAFRLPRKLKTEVVDMVELAMEKHDLSGNRMGVSVFGYNLENFIDEVSLDLGQTAFTNLDLYGAGAEVWAAYKVTDTLRLNGSYAFQRAFERKTGNAFGQAPSHMIFAEANYQFWPTWNLNVQLKWVSDRLRRPDDPRKNLDGYALLSANMRKEIGNGISLLFSARNLLNVDAREPSTDPLRMPGDIQLPGRTFLGRIEFDF